MPSTARITCAAPLTLCLRKRGQVAPETNARISEKPGAGEGIRTLDPNLGKVVLYP